MFGILLIYIFFMPVSTNVSNKALMKDVALELSTDLQTIQNDELGVEYIEHLYSITFEYTPEVIDVERTVKEIAHKLETKIENIFAALNRAKTAIENMQSLDNATKTRSSLQPCIAEKNLDLNSQVSRMCGTLIGLVLQKLPKDQLRVDFVLQKIKSSLKEFKNSVKQQYFISTFELETNSELPFAFCTERDHSLLWNNFINRNYYNARNIIIVLDHGTNMNKQHLSLTKAIAKQIISYLNKNDKIALLAISNDWTTPNITSDCLLPNQVPSINNILPTLHPANKTIKKVFYKFIKGLNLGSGPTNHSLGIEQALKIIQLSKVQNDHVMILYISRGSQHHSSSSEIKTILKSMLNLNDFNFVFNTIAIVNEASPLTQETDFLKDLTFQNYKKYNISTRVAPRKGDIVMINSTQSIGFTAAYFFSKFSNNSYNMASLISVPLWDYKSDDMAVSFSLGIYANNQFGLLGIDVYFANLAEDIIYFSNNQTHKYAFLMDSHGRVIIHPSYPSPVTSKEQLSFADISNFIKTDNSNELRKRFFTESQGTYIVNDKDVKFKFTWSRVGIWYVVCVVVREDYAPVRPYKINWPLNTSDPYSIRLVYQHLENSEGSKLCRHLNQIATLDAGSLYLSSSCFKSPNNKNNEDKLALQSYMAYLQDTTRLLVNPGLKEHVRDEVAALAHILTFLRNQHLNSYKSKFIVRRYVASYSGVLQMFPGSILEKGLDPTKRPWFLQAVEHKGKLVLIPPYLDEGGAGYIVTMAYATSNVVVAIDLTYGYVFRMLLRRMPFCTSSNITCFLMDDRGYLIYHPNLMNPNGHGPVEKQHIVHKESLVASDILSHETFIKKILCNSYGGGTVQRYYKLNTSFSDVLVNVVQGENCVAYHIVALENTNLFIGMVNATCNIVVTFCPCSIVDRLCFNCNRMEQKECECPCECPLEMDHCTESGYNVTDIPICTWHPEHVSLIAKFRGEPLDEMKSCFPSACTLETTHFGCLGVTGCEWCKYDVDGSVLTEPFCASLSTCFNGVLGSISPYKPYEITAPIESSQIPLSFILIFILGVLVIFILVYMYHRSTHAQTNERLYVSSTQDNQLRMSDLNLSDNHYGGNNHRDKLLQEEKPDPVSPYCVTSSYRRAAPPAESDHGYSTMTQHDESEHLSLAPIETDSLEDDLTSDNTSVHTSLSLKPTNNEVFTRIPNRNNCIVVPVTVHRNMELT